MATTDESLSLEAQVTASLIALQTAREKRLALAWARAWDEIAVDLQATLLEIITAAKGGRVSSFLLARHRRLRAALTVAGDRLGALLGEAERAAIADLLEVITAAGEAQEGIILAQLPPGVDVSLAGWDRISAPQIEAMVERTTERIHARHYPLQAEAVRAMKRELVRGIAAGSNPRATAARIIERTGGHFNGGFARAVNIARTEQIDAQRVAAARVQAKNSDYLEGWIWNARLGPRTCRACLSMHGRVFPLSQPGPQGHQQCRCSRSPKVKPWASLGFAVPEPPAAVKDAGRYFAGLSPAEQRAILGRDGWAAWKAGHWPITAWAVRQTNKGWRPSYVPARAPKVKGRAA